MDLIGFVLGATGVVMFATRALVLRSRLPKMEWIYLACAAAVLALSLSLPGCAVSVDPDAELQAEELLACSATQSAAHEWSILAACDWWTCTQGMCNSASGQTHNRVRLIDRGAVGSKRRYEFRKRACADDSGESCGSEVLWGYVCCTQSGTITCSAGKPTGC